MPSLCQNIKSHFEHLQNLTADFTVQYRAVKDSGDLTEVRKLKIQLEEARDSLLEQLCIFRVPDAINPYYDALRVAGLDRNETHLRQETKVNIRQEISRQLAVYRQAKDADGQSLLQDWITDISENEGSIYAEVANDRAKIKKRIKEGMIPLVMPSRMVQERTWKIALTNLKPIWYEGGTIVVVEDSGLCSEYETEKMDQSGFFKNIPNRPYLVWVKPTLRTNSDTRNRLFTNQQAYYATLITDHPDLYDQTDIIPTEYSVLQIMFTSALKECYQDLKGITSEPAELRPLDHLTFTRFLSAGLFSNGFAPGAVFNAFVRRVHFDGGAASAYDHHGFRPASRT